jgi:hypothetical protein
MVNAHDARKALAEALLADPGGKALELRTLDRIMTCARAGMHCCMVDWWPGVEEFLEAQEFQVVSTGCLVEVFW